MGGGALLVAALAVLLGVDLGVLTTIVAPALGVAGTAATGVLLIWDLKRPERALYIFLKSNFRSWLVWGSYALAAFAAVSGIWLLVGIGVETGLLASAHPALVVLAVLALPDRRAGGRLHRLPVRPGRGPRPVAVTAAVLAPDRPGGDGRRRRAGDRGRGHRRRPGRGRAHRHRAGLRHRRARPDAADRVRGQAREQAGRAGRPHDHPRPVRRAVLARRRRPGRRRGGARRGGDRRQVLALTVLAGIAVQVALLVYESVFVRAGQDPPLS